MGDSREALRGNLGLVNGSRAQLLFTSPPFHDLTSYHADQWLWLWLLGDGSTGCSTAGHAEAGIRPYSQDRYRAPLLDVFTSCTAMLAPEARVYVRAARQPFTYSATREALPRAVPGRRFHEFERPAPPSRSQPACIRGRLARRVLRARSISSSRSVVVRMSPRAQAEGLDSRQT